MDKTDKQLIEEHDKYMENLINNFVETTRKFTEELHIHPDLQYILVNRILLEIKSALTLPVVVRDTPRD